MKVLGQLMVAVTLLSFAACTGGAVNPPPNSGLNLTGTYTGQLTISATTPFVFEKATVTVDAAGKVTGTTLGSDSSGTPGGTGTLNGTLTVSDQLTQTLVYNLTFSSATLGTFTLKGADGLYVSAGAKIALQTNPDKAGSPTFAGLAIMTLTKQ